MDHPKDDIKPVYPFSFIGFNLGIQLTLTKDIFTDGIAPTKKEKKEKTPKIKSTKSDKMGQ